MRELGIVGHYRYRRGIVQQQDQVASELALVDIVRAPYPRSDGGSENETGCVTVQCTEVDPRRVYSPYRLKDEVRHEAPYPIRKPLPRNCRADRRREVICADK